jgi:hypothetical protein
MRGIVMATSGRVSCSRPQAGGGRAALVALILSAGLSSCGFESFSPHASSPVTGDRFPELCSGFREVARQRIALAAAYEMAFEGRLVEASASAGDIMTALLALSVPADGTDVMRNDLATATVVVGQAAGWLSYTEGVRPEEMREAILADGRTAVDIADAALARMRPRVAHVCPEIEFRAPAIEFPAR